MRGQGVPSGYFIPQKVACFFTVVERIVHLLGNELVVFNQPMIGPFREEQWRQIQSIDKKTSWTSFLKEVFGVVVDDVVATDVVGPF